MLYVRHQTATGGQAACWRYDKIRKEIFIALPRGTVIVSVCSTAAPRFAAFPLVRIDSSTWRIAPARYTARSAHGELITETCPIEGDLGVEPIALLDAPEDVAAELGEMENR